MRNLLASLFSRESPVRREILESELDADSVRCLIDLGLLRLLEDRFVPRARIDRVETLLIASDLRHRRWQGDFVVEPGPASFLLAAYVRPAVRGMALDLGCGSGVQSLLLAASGATAVGIDINPRAVGFARFNIALNALRRVSVQVGDFLTGADDHGLRDQFDTIVANPPFVLSPEKRLTYRDRPMPGDDVGARTVELVSRLLTPNGRGYILCNWIDRGDHWDGPVRAWLEGKGVDACVIRVADEDPTGYAQAWNRGLPEPDRTRAIQSWSNALHAEGVRRIHSGVIAMGRRSRPIRGRGRLAAIDRSTRSVTRQAVESFLSG